MIPTREEVDVAYGYHEYIDTPIGRVLGAYIKGDLVEVDKCYCTDPKKDPCGQICNICALEHYRKIIDGINLKEYVRKPSEDEIADVICTDCAEEDKRIAKAIMKLLEGK